MATMDRYGAETSVNSPAKRVSFNYDYKVSGGSSSPPSTANFDSGGVGNTGGGSNAYKPSGDPYSASASDYYSSSESYKSEAYKPAASSDTYSKPAPQRQNTSNSGYPSNYQTPTTPSNYQQSYQPAKPQPTSLIREPSTNNMNPPRSNPYPSANVPPLQRQQSSLNTAQRPYQPPPSQARPQAPAPKLPQQPSRPSTFTPTTQSYQSNPPPRAQQQTSQSYTPARPPSQRPPTTTASNPYTNSSSYSSNPPRSATLNYPPDSSRWEGNQTRPSQNRNYSPGYALDEDLKSFPDTGIADLSGDEKSGLQTKYQPVVRQKEQPSGESPAGVRPTSNTVPPSLLSDGSSKSLSRTNSSAKIIVPGSPLIKRESESLLEMAKITEDPSDKSQKDATFPRETTAKDLDLDLTDDFIFPKERPPPKSETPVTKNIKFFEENDKAKTPLIPKSPTFEKKEKPARPTHIEIVNKSSEAENEGSEDESGVDESPVKHPNLRSIAQPPKKVARISSAGPPTPKKPWVNPRASYPGTPTRVASAPPRSTPHTPKRSLKTTQKFKPEEELLNFFRGPVKKARFLPNDGADHSNGDHSAGKENRPTTNGVLSSPKKTPSKLPGPARKAPTSPSKTPLKSPSTAKSLPKTPESPAPPTPLIKKIPMNKIQVGAAPSPNLKTVKSKIGSLANTTHKPGGGNVKIESHKVNFAAAQPRIANKNDAYAPGGGEKKITQVKLQWNAKPKVGSLENTTYRPGGGEKKIESQKLDFKDKAKPKVGSKDNVKHMPGGGAVKTPIPSDLKASDVLIESQKVEFKAQSKIGSLDNVKHKPGGGDVKIFDDKTYMKQVSASGSGTQTLKIHRVENTYGRTNKPDCDLSVVTEVRGIRNVADGEATDISIKKTTTIAASRPAMSKTTEVTVVTRSPTKERRGTPKSPSTHEVKLTYSSVSSPTKKVPSTYDPKPIEVIKVPAVEDAPVLNPSAKDKEAVGSNPPLPSYLSSKNDRKETVREVEVIETDKGNVPEISKEPPIAKLLQNEAAAHEKVGEIWKEVQNAGFPAPQTKQGDSQQQKAPQPQQYQSQQQQPQYSQPQRPPQPPPQQYPPQNNQTQQQMRGPPATQQQMNQQQRAPQPMQYPQLATPPRPNQQQQPLQQGGPFNPPPAQRYPSQGPPTAEPPRYPPSSEGSRPPSGNNPPRSVQEVPTKMNNPLPQPQQQQAEYYNQVPKSGSPTAK